LLCVDLCRGIVEFQGKTRAVALEPVQEVTIKKKLPTKQRRVVVTGLGVVTPLGHDPDVFYNNLLNGVSGISEIENFDCAEFPTVSYI
jgi:3-oxoacyl-[acyl-carrier-protein] synthase II